MRLLNFTIIKLTSCLVLGIILAYFLNINLNTSLIVTIGFLVLLIVSLIISNKQFTRNLSFGILAFITTICIGITTTNLHNQKKANSHYNKFIKPNSEDLFNITFRVRSVLKSGNFHDKYIIDILKVDDKLVTGKSLLNIKKDSLQKLFRVDDILITSSSFKELINPLNPGQFNYKNYLEKQYIYHQIFSEYKNSFSISSNKHTLFGYASALREKINSKLKTYNIQHDELSIINALLLGQRQDISKETYNNYTNAGAIHILAVSGLHVGIILLLLSFVFKPIENLKHGKLIKTILLIFLLWSFALIAGLSASVTRAVTMFSIVAIAVNLKRPTNIYNTLAISMFILLLFKPMFLFDVGFQLSYLAVFAIVWVQPLLYKFWIPKHRILDFFWKILTVTLAAQLGIIPVSLFYFHQFPGLFFISNLGIIPILGIILGLGLLVILLALINMLPAFLAEAYGNIIGLMNSFVAWVAQQEQFLFKSISFGGSHLIVFYVFIIALIYFIKKKSAIRLQVLLGSIVLIQLVFIFNSYKTSSNSFTIFHKGSHTILAKKQNNHLVLAHNLDSIAKQKDKTILNYKVSKYIKTTSTNSIKNIYNIDDKLLLIIDSLGVYNNISFKPDYILLRNSPKINLQRMIDSLRPKIIIADGSNYKSYIKRWEATCEKQKLPFHQTSEKGAFVIEYAK